MNKIMESIRCAYGVSVVINNVTIRFSREEVDGDFSLGDHKYTYHDVVALASVASEVVIDKKSSQISFHRGWSIKGKKTS